MKVQGDICIHRVDVPVNVHVPVNGHFLLKLVK